MRPMPANGFDCLKNVHFTMLDNLLDGHIGRTIDAHSCLAVAE